MNKFDIQKLEGNLARIRDWMRDHHITPKITFYLLGVLSTIWFLIRVIPKPSRASYPCMRVAAPFMSGFVVYILTLGGITIALRKARQNILRARYMVAGSFLFAALVGTVLMLAQGSQDATAISEVYTGPDDGPNQPMGKAIGINPGRVVWAWDPEATIDNPTGKYYSPENNNQEAVSKMLGESVKKLTGEKTIQKSWDVLFRSFNNKRHSVDKGYTPGEKIFIKINQQTARIDISRKQREKGDYSSSRPDKLADGSTSLGTTQTSPPVSLELLRHLVNHCGIDQSDIAIGDPQNPTFGYNYDIWAAEFPDVVYTDKLNGTYGRTLIHETSDEMLFYSDKTQSDKLYDIIENAEYMINVANLKHHTCAGISLTAKNHFGSHSRENALHLHYSLISPIVSGYPSNGGYGKYRVQVDLMGSTYLGQNTLLYIVDGLYGGGGGEGGPPVKYFITPFNNDWSSSIFISQDQVALESVCFDFLRTEFNVVNKHSTTNNRHEAIASVRGVDDYLHQAADKFNWPVGVIYDPDNSGKPLPSLGVHEHWNNPEMKQYSRNLGKSVGIELVSIPSKIVGPKAARMASNKQKSEEKTEQSINPETKSVGTGFISGNKESKFNSVSYHQFSRGFSARKFFSGVVDDGDIKWFLTENGLARGRFSFFDTAHKIPIVNPKSLAYQSSSNSSKIWVASPHEIIVADLPYDSNSVAKVYDTKNSPLFGDSIIAITAGQKDIQWIGTEQGISGMYNNKWLSPLDDDMYPDYYFELFPITTMATDLQGDSLYVATIGAGVGRFYRNDVDVITGASTYAEWGPIKMPSDNVYSICITEEAQWFGTDKGIAKHVGYNTLENWTIYNTQTGLVNNFVQALALDSSGNLWVGTKEGLSIFDGSEWTSYTIQDGLTSNNILSIVCDKHGTVFLGADNGFMVYNNGHLICYQ